METKNDGQIEFEFQEEIWKDIPNHPNHQASNKGRVRTKGHFESMLFKGGKPGQRYRNDKIHSPHINRGYVYVCVDNRSYGVHHLVNLAFHGIPPKEKFHTNHISGIKTDNSPENLEWVTPSENELHSHRVLGKRSWNLGKPFPNVLAKINRVKNHHVKCLEVLKMRTELNLSAIQIADKLGISSRQVHLRIKTAKGLPQ